MTLSWALGIQFLLLTSHQKDAYVEAICTGPSDMFIKRENYLLCRRYYNCLPGNEILPCKNPCERERCEPCPDGKIQPNLIHSVTRDSERRCFTPEPNQCTTRDLVATQNGRYDRTCPIALHCQCDLSKCFYGNDPCVCNRELSECQEGFTLHNNGSCMPCPEGSYKLYTGCEACFLRDPYVDQTSQTPQPITPVPRVPATTTKTTTTIRPADLPRDDLRRSTVSMETTQAKAKVTWMVPKHTLIRTTVSMETTPAKAKVTLGMVDTTSEASNTIPVIIVIILVLLISIATVVFILYKKRKLHHLRDRLCGQRTTEEAGVRPVEPETIVMLPDLLNNGRMEADREPEDTVPVQEEVPGSPSSADSHPLIPPSSPGVTLDEPPLSKVLQMKEAIGGGHCSLESYTSGTSSGSVPTPVPETGPSGGSHPLENVREYLRSLSREETPAHYGFPIPEDNSVSTAAAATSPTEGSTINVSSSTSAVPLNSSSTSTSYPSPIVSDSMETVGSQDHRVSAINRRDTNLESPKAPQQSLLTNSLSSDNADNIHALGTLEPLENEDETFKNDQCSCERTNCNR